jgi:sugar-specific transcriptional regulator TrmB
MVCLYCWTSSIIQPLINTAKREIVNVVPLINSAKREIIKLPLIKKAKDQFSSLVLKKVDGNQAIEQSDTGIKNWVETVDEKEEWEKLLYDRECFLSFDCTEAYIEED